MIETHIKPAIGKHHLSKLTQQHIQAMLNNLAVSASTARLVRSIVRAALRQAMEWDLVGRNVAALTKSPKGEQFEGYALSPDEVRNVMATVSGDDLEALYAIPAERSPRAGRRLPGRVRVNTTLGEHDWLTTLGQYYPQAGGGPPYDRREDDPRAIRRVARVRRPQTRVRVVRQLLLLRFSWEAKTGYNTRAGRRS
jgi:hypothetical protein